MGSRDHCTIVHRPDVLPDAQPVRSEHLTSTGIMAVNGPINEINFHDTGYGMLSVSIGMHPLIESVVLIKY